MRTLAFLAAAFLIVVAGLEMSRVFLDRSLAPFTWQEAAVHPGPSLQRDQQPGKSARRAAQTEPAQAEQPLLALQGRISQTQKELRQVDEQLNKLDQSEIERDQHGRDLQQQIVAQQAALVDLQQTYQKQKQAQLQKYTSENIQHEYAEVESSRMLNQYQEQLAAVKKNLDSFQWQINLLSSRGFPGDDITAAKERYQNEYRKYQALASQFDQARVQAGQAAFSQKANQEWQKSEDRQNLDQRYQASLKQESAKLEQLMTQYQKWRQTDSNQNKQSDQLHAQYQNLRNQLFELQTQAESQEQQAGQAKQAK